MRDTFLTSVRYVCAFQTFSFLCLLLIDCSFRLFILHSPNEGHKHSAHFFGSVESFSPNTRLNALCGVFVERERRDLPKLLLSLEINNLTKRITRIHNCPKGHKAPVVPTLRNCSGDSDNTSEVQMEFDNFFSFWNFHFRLQMQSGNRKRGDKQCDRKSELSKRNSIIWFIVLIFEAPRKLFCFRTFSFT